MTHKAQQKAAAEFWKSYFSKFSARRRTVELEPDTMPAPLALEERNTRVITPQSAAKTTFARNGR